MNKNGEKEGKRSKAQKKDNKSAKVNKARASDNKTPENDNGDKLGQADDISNKFPNFSLLNEEERVVFYQALTAARKNVERRGIPTRERFGTVHDEYLKFFNQDDKKEVVDDVTASIKTNDSLTDSGDPSCRRSSGTFDSGDPSQEKLREKSHSPTLLLQGSSEAPLVGPSLVTMEPQVVEQCESLIQEDTDKVLGLYLKKKKKNEVKAVEFRVDIKKPEQGLEKKPPKVTKKEPGEREMKKESTQQAPRIPKPRETPRFDALSAEEREIFFETLQEARNNVLGKNPDKKNEILPLDAIMRRYRDDRQTMSVYSTVQELPKTIRGKKNLRVKVNLTSGDNERLLRAKSEGLSETERKEEQRRYSSRERRRPEDLALEENSEVELRKSNSGEWQVDEKVSKGKLKTDEKISAYAVSKRNEDSNDTINLRLALELKSAEYEEEMKSSPEVKLCESGKTKGKSEKTQKAQSELRRSSVELSGKSISSASRSSTPQKDKKAAEDGKKKKKEVKKKKKRKGKEEEEGEEEEDEKEEEMGKEELFSELTFPDLSPEQKKLVEEDTEECEEFLEPSCVSVKEEERPCDKSSVQMFAEPVAEPLEKLYGRSWSEIYTRSECVASVQTSLEGSKLEGMEVGESIQTVCEKERSGEEEASRVYEEGKRPSCTTQVEEGSSLRDSIQSASMSDTEEEEREQEKTKKKRKKRKKKKAEEEDEEKTGEEGSVRFKILAANVEEEKRSEDSEMMEGCRDRREEEEEERSQEETYDEKIGREEGSREEVCREEESLLNVCQDGDSWVDVCREEGSRLEVCQEDASRVELCPEEEYGIEPGQGETEMCREEGSKIEVYRGEEGSREFPGVSSSPKVMIVDDNVIEKIRKLIYYLEAKTGKDSRLEKEYMKLLVDYVDYLSKVLEVLAHKKEQSNQVSAYPAEVSDTKRNNKEQKSSNEKADSNLPRSVSQQNFSRKTIFSKEESATKTEENKSEMASLVSSNSDLSAASEEVNFVPPPSRSKKVIRTKIRLLQDLLKKRAEFVEGSTGELRVTYNESEEFAPTEGPPIVKLITEEDEENIHRSGKAKFFRNIVKCFTCGAKKEEEEGIFENLKGEAVRVDVCEATSKDPANATLNLSTMEVLKAAGRKRIIEKYYKS